MMHRLMDHLVEPGLDAAHFRFLIGSETQGAHPGHVFAVVRMVFSPGLLVANVIKPMKRHSLAEEHGLLRPVHACDLGEPIPFHASLLAELRAQTFYKQAPLAAAGLLVYKGLPESLSGRLQQLHRPPAAFRGIEPEKKLGRWTLEDHGIPST